MFIKPLMDRVLLENVEVEQKVGSIVLAGEKKVDYLHGIVIALGPGKQKASGEYVPIPLELGQLVIYGNVSSTLEDMVDGKKVYLVEQNAIVGIIHEDAVQDAVVQGDKVDIEFASLSAHIPEHKVADEPQQEVYRDVQDHIVPRTPSSDCSIDSDQFHE